MSVKSLPVVYSYQLWIKYSTNQQADLDLLCIETPESCSTVTLLFSRLVKLPNLNLQVSFTDVMVISFPTNN